MKIAITKIGANITFSSNNKSAANADILYALRTLGIKDHDITMCTGITRNTYIPKPLKVKDITEINSFNEYDVVLVFNGSINFFGGNMDKNLIALYIALAKSKIPIIYIQTDGQLWFQDLWPLISNRPWANQLEEYSFDIDPSLVFYITQGRDISKVSHEITRKPNRIYPRNIFTFPWEKTILAGHERFFNFEPKRFRDRPFHLAFGGATRNTHKRKKIEKFYNHPNVKTMLFGNLRGVNCPNAFIRPKVSYQDFIPSMELAMATVIIGDKFYNDNFFTLRMYESILAGNLVLIDQELDSNQAFYHHLGNRDMFYVNNADDVEAAVNWPNAQEIAFNIRDKILKGYDLQVERSTLNFLLEATHENI